MCFSFLVQQNKTMLMRESTMETFTILSKLYWCMFFIFCATKFAFVMQDVVTLYT